MSLDVDQYEIELLVEAIQYRIENDETFLLNHCLKQELEDLLGKIQDEFNLWCLYWQAQDHRSLS